MRPPITKQYGLQIAKEIKNKLLASPYPIIRIYLFGSCARGETFKDSDIDIAVVCEPFNESRVKEVVTFYALIRGIDTRTEIIVLHPEDMENRYLTIAQEVKREGAEV